MSSTDQPIDLAAIDFNAVYRNEAFPGFDSSGVPWDIRDVQPAVVELEAAGRFTGDVLDIGCGLGDNAVFLAGRGHSVTAIDGSSVAIEQARQRAAGSDIEFAVADATRLTGYEDRFDSVLDSALFHALDQQLRPLYAAALHRATRPGARLSMLCFSDAPGGMPAPFAVPESELRGTLSAAGWTVTDLSHATYFASAAVVNGFLEPLGRPAALDGQGRAKLAIWQVLADRS
ncbi:class I SAM-dependent methyltransferase [Pseudonocardiaceae bacterium YIM PH 21723]|nr:class I SAM-dependent methyltransferase [Pseudonocardiaceae bacterium YIM PH 21723]